MSDTAFDDQLALWILIVNVLLHELGVPVPMLPVALVAGARAGSGAIDPLLLVLAILATTLIGNSVWFAAGRRNGAGALTLLCRVSLSPDTCVARTEKAFGRWGGLSLVMGRFLPGVSLIAPPLAGALGMSWGRFLILTSASAVLYGLVLVGAGMLFHAQIESVMRELAGFGWWHALAALFAATVTYVAWRGLRRRHVPRMPHALPGVDGGRCRALNRPISSTEN
jgi:membrane protein DedA with SNARE-associated domain